MSSVRRTSVVAAATAVAALALSAFAAPLFARGVPYRPKPAPKPAPAAKPPPEPKPKDIIDTLAASADPAFKSLLDALKAADLTTTLKGSGPFTLFAPTDDAFKKLPVGKLAEWMKPESKAVLRGILYDHVLASKMLASDLAKAKTVKTAGSHTLDVKVGDDKAWAGFQDSKATKTDVVAANGIIHFMDSVFLPKADPPKADPGMTDPPMGK